ncbi:MAG TPA: tetratricopeptide repeat protein [Planctomycetia bacterium]|nr:tetratricopeptide repeat protein [Planctomycetia bacterium]
MIGECWFHQRQYDKALREYLRAGLGDGFPDWQAAALVQAGKCHELRRESKDAAETYRKVTVRFPKSPAAQQASERLAALTRAGVTGN